MLGAWQKAAHIAAAMRDWLVAKVGSVDPAPNRVICARLYAWHGLRICRRAPAHTRRDGPGCRLSELVP